MHFLQFQRTFKEQQIKGHNFHDFKQFDLFFSHWHSKGRFDFLCNSHPELT